jgi:O-antigen ligase
MVPTWAEVPPTFSLTNFALSPVLAAIRNTWLIFIFALAIFLFRPPDVDLYQADRIVFGLLAASCLLRAFLLRKRLLPSLPMLWPMALLAGLSVLTTWGQPFNAQTWSLLAAKFIVPYSLYYLAGFAFDTPTSLRRLETFLLVTLAYLCFTAIAQLVGFDALVFPRFILDPSIGIHTDRARGPFLQAVANGVVLNMLGLVALDSYRRGRLRGLAGALLLASLPIAILATMTRAVWISFLGSIAWIGISASGVLRKASIALLGMAAVGLLISLAAPNQLDALADRAGEQGPIDIRLAIYRAALGMAAEKPLLGWGVNQMPQEVVRRVEGYQLEAYWAHNSYLEILVENGLVGLALYVSIAIGLLRAGRGRTTDEDWRGTLAGNGLRRLWPVLVCVYLLNACFVVMNYQFVNALIFTLAGILAAREPFAERRGYATAVVAG